METIKYQDAIEEVIKETGFTRLKARRRLDYLMVKHGMSTCWYGEIPMDVYAKRNEIRTVYRPMPKTMAKIKKISIGGRNASLSKATRRWLVEQGYSPKTAQNQYCEFRRICQDDAWR